MKNRNFEILLTVGAGDLNLFTAKLANEVKAQQ